MTNEEFKEMYEEYNSELYHSWLSSLDPVKRAAQQAKQKAYNAAYYLKNKVKWEKYRDKARGAVRSYQDAYNTGMDSIARGAKKVKNVLGNRQENFNTGMDTLIRGAKKAARSHQENFNTGMDMILEKFGKKKKGYDLLPANQVKAREQAAMINAPKNKKRRKKQKARLNKAWDRSSNSATRYSFTKKGKGGKLSPGKYSGLY